MGQHDLVAMLKILIDASRAKGASRTRDDARKALRDVMGVTNWNTAFVLRSLGARRCRYLAGIGYPIPAGPALRSDVDRLNDWARRRG